MVTLDIGSWAETAVGGSMLLALPVALVAGLVSFFSPCVVPLLPGYLSYATGLGAAEVIEGPKHRSRMLLGTVGFVLGFAVIFVITGVVAGSVGQVLYQYRAVINRVLGVVVIVLGLIFAGLLPIGQRDLRSHRVSAAAVAHHEDSMPFSRAEHDRLANAIRALAMDAVEQAKSGHPGLPMGAADIATVLFTRFLKIDPSDPIWPDRDRFVLSAGHGSMLIYALLHLLGFEKMTIEELKRFRQSRSLTPGHPENFVTPGIETTTGPLGQGLANAVGMAI